MSQQDLGCNSYSSTYQLGILEQIFSSLSLNTKGKMIIKIGAIGKIPHEDCELSDIEFINRL